METARERREEEEQQQVPISIKIPRGGPIYLPHLVGPLTRVPDFQSSLLTQLQSLEAELCLDSSQLCHLQESDITVDELKIFTEEELVDMALKEALKDGDDDYGDKDNNNKQFSQPSNSKPRKTGRRPKSTREHASSDNSGRGENASSEIDGSDEPLIKTRRIERRQANALAKVEASYIAKVEEIAKIKQKQDKDKAAARLHSFNGSWKMNECPAASSETIARMKSLRSTSKHLKSSVVQENRAVLYPEVVLCVEVYDNRRKYNKTQELLVLGCQLLTELRDKICCLTDRVMQKVGQHDPSGYFLIEDVFYNDLRDPSAIDYSEPIFDWLRNSKDDALRKWECINNGDLLQKQKAILGSATASDLPRFKAFDMHKIRFCDLRFRLGAGYLYCHQGACKHIIVIRDMRLIHPEDVRNRAAYPIVIFQIKLRAQKCSVCNINIATKVTLDDKWAQENPCYFCDYCYSLLHSQEGPSMYSDYSVYDYVHD
ncbi:zf-SNAP50_C domain-containing protein [Cephalotus follicularis]|uniref:Zf-SNAP50_C domain-containing protein n=1 Tax=Cephalotus follicularis TaxID=3775 RepID=A0A1Q3BRR1_CEPFO|nr:zf-SNAP50_C domain-containing protein [Cephalotus follicularis]